MRPDQSFAPDLTRAPHIDLFAGGGGKVLHRPRLEILLLLSISVAEGTAAVAQFECYWRSSGADFRTALFLAANLAQFQAICAIARDEEG